ncbi:Scr1 family TA system antitoxin-like transcriptional regulator [Lentzea sp. E54]|uniref:Scr1 family TA system antitoxin-like transcriptional regulator n=1 Tax=Lentzea xerophila TaxID=3435883 RepID=UPI003DA6A6DB
MPIAYSETDLTQVFVQDLGAIARTRLIFNRLAEVALEEEQSRRKLAEYVGTPREDLDDRGPHLA